MPEKLLEILGDEFEVKAFSQALEIKFRILKLRPLKILRLIQSIWLFIKKVQLFIEYLRSCPFASL